MRMKKFMNFCKMVKSRKVAAAAATPVSKGGKKQASRVKPYTTEMEI
jgi:ribosomal 50S subunit-recycling heat shock protein